jgi:cellulose biosynthesis protein BcsQ
VSAPEPGKVIAFYSFKGGTGRSMALANIGCVLAQQSQLERPILLIDWDLEAPGLHRYFRAHLFNVFGGDEKLQDQFPGLIDLFLELQPRIADGADLTPEQDLLKVRQVLDEFPLERYIIETDIPRLHLLKAGRFDRDYAANIGAFRWPELYRQSPHLLRGLADRLARDYSFVIIDSRTGLTDTSSICAMLMPEILVIVFTPNRQNLSGVIDLVREAARYRAESNDLRPLVVYPLPSRIEASEPGLRQMWRFGDRKKRVPSFQEEFEKIFKEIYALPECNLGSYFDDVQIQHVPRYAYGEEIAVLAEESRDRFSLTRSFQRFAARLIEADTPWERAALSDESFSEEGLPNRSTEEASRRLASDAYLKRVDEALAKQTTQAHRLLKLSNWLFAAGIILSIGGLAFQLVNFFLHINIGVQFYSTAFVILGVIAVFAVQPLRSRGNKAKWGADDIRGELQDYEKGEPPYEGELALQRLRDRVDPLIWSGAERPEAKTRVYISYRRADTPDIALRLADSLRAEGDHIDLSMDMTDLRPGEDFATRLEAELNAADVVIVLIGPNWRGSRGGERRIDNDYDHVRMEVKTALARGVRVIPVLVKGARMPRAEQLPEDIRSLALRQAASLNQESWPVDLKRLYDAITPGVGSVSSSSLGGRRS